MARKAYKFRFYPTPEQALLLAKSFGCKRFVWNNTLAWRNKAYKDDGESISQSQAEKRLVILKEEFPFLEEISSVLFQQALRDQAQGFKNFFEGRAQYPQFKKRNRRQSFRLTKAAFRLKEDELYIAKSKEPLNVVWSRALPSAPTSITISKDCAGRYFVSLLCEFEPKFKPISAKLTGFDLGLTHLLIDSDGNKYDNPRYTLKYQVKLAYLQRKYAKKKKGSMNREKFRLKIARLHAKIADCRTDNLHQLSTQLVNENQVICVESLAVKNMVKNRKLAKHIADASWGEFTRQLVYKGDWLGRSVIEIDQWLPSSKACSTTGCDFNHKKLPLNARHWTCPVCGAVHDRDVNAAINIKAAGLAVLACGVTGSGIRRTRSRV
ncbi:transposase [Vibrio sp. 1-Bac 57]|uniref:RNA-guided endonuclease InsQ/TnpB family protein n=1 Tax=Psychromonas arctica TaxID=168275 RepID=UPI0003FFD502|nr:RNA-guided endonuclease TnpB family protein [Psychromonas arctica]